MKVGILFGGPSREREISFAGGRTVYDNLSRALFEPVPIFVDSFNNFILLDWQYVYKGSIRDFYPPQKFVTPTENHFQVYAESLANLTTEQIHEMAHAIGQLIPIEQLKHHIDFAFLALHGVFGEDGQVQGLLETQGIPYSGSGILPSAIGINKAFQKRALQHSGLTVNAFTSITRQQWDYGDRKALFEHAVTAVGNKLVIKPANQGSSIGVSIIEAEYRAFVEAMNKAFFRAALEAWQWKSFDTAEKVSYLRELSDIREGLGLPILLYEQVFYHQETLLLHLNQYFNNNTQPIVFQAFDSEQEVLIESFIQGREFSCIVLKTDDGKVVALPPTEIVKGQEVFDYRSKYLAGLSRKVTPIQVSEEQIEAIRSEAEQLFNFFGFNVYARIDGFITDNAAIYLNDPNTTSGMLPSSFFFHQAAEIGLNPSQFLTYIIRCSLQERLVSSKLDVKLSRLLKELDAEIADLHTKSVQKKKIAVIMGGYSSERHISVESGRNIYEKLSSSLKYEPVPIFLTGDDQRFDLYQIPVNILLKDNADDIKDKVLHYKKHSILLKIRSECNSLTNKYSTPTTLFEPTPITFEQLAKQVDGVFIALHGRPGEDGALQNILEQYGLPYNGSGVASSALTINKFETNQFLKKHGFKVADQQLFYKVDYIVNPENFISQIAGSFSFPLIAKPVDDGCSSAVKKIDTEEELAAYIKLLFRDNEGLDIAAAALLKLKPKEEFSQKEVVLIEDFIDSHGAKYFLEVTGGMLTIQNDDGDIVYEVFEPSETLAGGGILSLEEKFLAGEGQNITPARFGNTPQEYETISHEVKATLKKAAQLLNIEGYCRIDAFVRVSQQMEVETIIIEVNSLPGMTPATVIFHQAAINGYKPFDFIDHILTYSFKKHHIEQP